MWTESYPFQGYFEKRRLNKKKSEKSHSCADISLASQKQHPVQGGTEVILSGIPLNVRRVSFLEQTRIWSRGNDEPIRGALWGGELGRWLPGGTQIENTNIYLKDVERGARRLAFQSDSVTRRDSMFTQDKLVCRL